MSGGSVRVQVRYVRVLEALLAQSGGQLRPVPSARVGGGDGQAQLHAVVRVVAQREAVEEEVRVGRLPVVLEHLLPPPERLARPGHRQP
jgi:hypothetical protein